jgi:hypothetical protein
MKNRNSFRYPQLKQRGKSMTVNRIIRILVLGAGILAALPAPGGDAAETETCLRRALGAMAALQHNGGWGRAYARHRGVMWGEHNPRPASWITVQPPATPVTAMLFLEAGRLLEEPAYITVAEKARDGLAALQTPEGGFPHEGDPASGNVTAPGTFDDNVTTAALDFFIAWWRYTGKAEDAALVHEIGDFILAAQYADSGGWPQRYPVRGGYGRHITFNDNAMVLAMRALMKLEKETGDKRYRKALEKGAACILKLQGGPGEEIWAQQYDAETLQPAWARKFEPPGYSSAESAGVCRLLIDLYLEYGRKAYLDAVEKALAWYETHRLPNGKWARLHEPGTQRPVYGRRDKAEKVYDFEKACSGYSWQGNWYPADVAETVQRIHTQGRSAVRQARMEAERSAHTPAAPDTAALDRLCDSLSEAGYWLRAPGEREKPFLVKAGCPEDEAIIDLGLFNRNARQLLDALSYSRNGEPDRP